MNSAVRISAAIILYVYCIGFPFDVPRLLEEGAYAQPPLEGDNEISFCDILGFHLDLSHSKRSNRHQQSDY